MYVHDVEGGAQLVREVRGEGQCAISRVGKIVSYENFLRQHGFLLRVGTEHWGGTSAAKHDNATAQRSKVRASNIRRAPCFRGVSWHDACSVSGRRVEAAPSGARAKSRAP